MNVVESRFSHPVALGAVAAVLVLAACGGSDKKSDPTPTPSSSDVAPTATAGSSAAAPTGTMNGPVETAAAQATKMSAYEGELDACKLVSKDKAEEIMGESLSGDPWNGIEGLPNLTSYCNYNPSSVPGQEIVDGKTVQLAVITKADIEFFDPSADVGETWDKGKLDTQSEDGYQPVSGLGDDAYFSNDSGLNVLNGEMGLTVRGLSLDKDKQFMQAALDAL